MSILRVAILGPLGLPEEEIRATSADLLGEPATLDFHMTVAREAEAILSAACEADAVVLSNLPFPAEVVRGCPRLGLLSLSFTGTDRIDLAACAAAGVTVCNTPGYSTTSVAEFTVGLILAALRRIPEGWAGARNGGTWQGLVGSDLAGKTVGIVGTGAIGLRVAGMLGAFGCTVLGFTRSAAPKVRAIGIDYVDLGTLLSRSDVVSLHLPLTDETRGLIGRDRIALMKKSAVLVNTARGGLVDQDALIEALREGRLAAAALDTVDPRPPLPADHPLFALPNVLVTPHMAFATHESGQRRIRVALENVAAWRAGLPQNVVQEPSTPERLR